eukprot:CAMPEP_0181317542 /NCGR_PEP_ID=MMETSP1101-20121128/16525_1 /TAXON_ID=46948 /ORGANISM="Rhodomonas abbreviata, Strain Caron Lab Isolate" /LENGTH=552 /DNA_ID=CAMNT_0023424945 /DNA_START=533 /DNA_END=2192 /DNA_ORIENTATION=+
MYEPLSERGTNSMPRNRLSSKHLMLEIPSSRQQTAMTDETTILSPVREVMVTSINSDIPESKFYTLKLLVEEILFPKEEGEDDLQLQVSLSLDGTSCLTKVIRKTHEERIMVPDEPFLFQPRGSPVGSLLMVKLMAAALAQKVLSLPWVCDLSTISVGGSTAKVVCTLLGEVERQRNPQVTLRLRICARRKSFTFSYLKADPVFRRSGYAVTAAGLSSFPQPYKKHGLPNGVTFSSLTLGPKVSEDVVGLEVYRAWDKLGGQYTIKKYLIMDTACRELLISELDGLIDCPPGQGMALCDAFLEGVKVCVVLDDEGGVYLRDALAERGPAPEMVASIVLRQVLQMIRYMHENKSRLHNDVDARNVLCLRNGEVRIGGFAYSMKLVGKASKFSGPFVHMSPERLLGLECSFPADVWSAGILAVELALGRCPYDLARFQGPNALFEFKKMAVSEPSPSLKGVAHCSEELRSFVDQCLHKNMRARSTPPELLAHPFITRYEGFTLPAGSWLTKKAYSSSSPPRNPEFTFAPGMSKETFPGGTGKGEGKSPASKLSG